ncbi:hypothetical protein CMI37_15120 [Candidatus Pacearchaeota archaeon]|nr:hypothetical protein [Candidatus Pacearchaeota archaeon]
MPTPTHSAQQAVTMKILLAPAWDHNFPYGPSSWLSASQTGTSAYAPQDGGHASTGRITTLGDTYYRDHVSDAVENAYKVMGGEPWWSYKSSDGPVRQMFVYDADPRVFNNSGVLQAANTATGSGGGFGTGTLTVSGLTRTAEQMSTKNRFRSTGLPRPFFNAANTATLDLRYQGTGTADSSPYNYTITGVRAFANHWQDAVHDAVLQGSNPDDDTAASYCIYPNKPGDKSGSLSSFGSSGTIQEGANDPDSAHQKGSIWSSSGGSTTNVYTYAYEYVLDVDSLTHSWDTVSTVTTLPATSVDGSQFYQDAAQLSALAIDIGAMRETITVQGWVNDNDNTNALNNRDTTSSERQSTQATGERPIRKQQLMDIARGQWGAIASPATATSGSEQSMSNPNRFVALTIGPMYTDNDFGDAGDTFAITPNSIHGIDNPSQHSYQIKALDMWRFGDEPSDDIRGGSLLRSDFGTELNHVNEVFDYQFTYRGRRRYRGVITNLNFTLDAGSPDIWKFTFDFTVFKNETTFRNTSTSAGIEKEDGGFWSWLPGI